MTRLPVISGKAILAALVITFLTLAALPVIKAQQPATPKREVKEMVKCLRLTSDKPDLTSLDCGVNEKGEAQILDIPIIVYQFPQGTLFTLYIYSDGTEDFPRDRQPKGSIVLKTKPCPIVSRAEKHPPANAGPCNPQ